MSRVPKHFGLSYEEELKMLKELEKVRKQTRKDFLKFKLVQESKSKRSPRASSALPRDFNNYSSQSSESSYEAFARDKTVPPEPCPSALQDPEKQSHDDPRKKIQGSKLPFKESRKTSLADRPRNQPFCPKEFYLKNTAYIYQRGKEKPVIASLAGTSKQAILFKQPVPPHKSRYRRVILRRRLPTPQFPLPLEKRDWKTEPSSLPESYHAEDIMSKETMTSEHETEKISLRKRRWVGPRREGISYSFQAEKKRKKSLISSPVIDVKLQEEPAIEVPIEEKKEPQPETQAGEKTPEMHLPLRDVPGSIEEIIVSLQSERQSAVDKMIRDLIESVLGQNYDIKMEEISLITHLKYPEDVEEGEEGKREEEEKKEEREEEEEKEEEEEEKEEEEKEEEEEEEKEKPEKKESTEEFPGPEETERMTEGELSPIQTNYELAVEGPQAERANVELLQTVLDTKILSELPTLLETTQNKLPKRTPGPFQDSAPAVYSYPS
ncbi:tetratricopeptide repeat protein 6 isoform X2 [Petaurus breviceps papuanus]|uniref:tetratricopeptide repeat protein 6 isoform X2 n=1 Tax=Petaurus breviceps papuanus TaxID=3040969 RepID=UPI0036DC0F3A